MALFTKADFVGTHVVDTAAKRDFVLRRSNNKGHQHFESMSIAAGGTAPPLTLATMLQTYVLDTAAKVEQVLQNSPTGASGLRGHEFMTAVKFLSIAPLSTVDVAGPAASVSFTLSGLFVSPTVLNLAIDADTGTDLSTAIAFSTDYLTPEEAASQVAGAINAIGASMVATSAGPTVTVAAQSPALTLTITTAAVA